MRKVLVLALALPLFVAAAQKGNITTREAKDHIGQVETVCGKVVSTHYAARSKGQPTFINLDEPYPHEIFTIVIWGSDRSKFGAPESKYQHSRLRDREDYDLSWNTRNRGERSKSNRAVIDNFRENLSTIWCDSPVPRWQLQL
jgi:hypothetical protein